MLTVFDVHLELPANAELVKVVMLREHFKALSIDVIGLDRGDFTSLSDELTFSIYGDIGPFMMQQMVRECTENIFPGSTAGFLSR